MKSGVRALGVAESYPGTARAGEGARSTLAGAVLRADRVLDGLAFGTCTVGGTDATDAVARLWTDLDRPDVRYLLLAGVAPAWYNLLDLRALHERTDRPVLAVTFEAGDEPLDDALARAFSGDELEARVAMFERLPARSRLPVNGETVFVRAAGCGASEARDVVRAFTPEGGRPEPLRVARLAARAGRELAGDDPGARDGAEPV
ncbi:DUF99 domain-containing protein [Halobacteriales archaeon QS_5_70_15]|nr:MAG: DUF99 domain-containing protein [Halobacteriales archaeon QS_5_70_15]